MDFKKSHFSDQLPYCSTPMRRNKVVSRFGLGMLISLILVVLVFYHVSFKAPLLESVWQGFHNNTTLSFWSFSSRTSCFYSSSCINNVSSVNGLAIERWETSAVRNDRNENASKNATLGNSADEKGKNGMEIVKNSTLSNPNSQEKVLEEPKKENLSKNVRNEYIISNDNSPNLAKTKSFYGDCDIFHGRWVKEDTKPYYPSGSCSIIDRDFNCHLNKRPDMDYLKWKWRPYECDTPSLNATDFLERLRGKRLVFVGDSLNRNMWESLVCILRHSVRDKEKVYEISGRMDFKKGGFYAFRFEDYNCSVDFVNSPFLVRESSFNGVNGSFETLRLDLMDNTTSMYQDADILIFNTAHWWTHEKTSRGVGYYQEGKHVHRKLKVLEAYKRAISTWARWVDKHINKSRTRIIFRGYSEVHFSGGQWNTGGQCHKETEPIFDESQLEKYPRTMKALEYVLQGMKTPVIYLNITRLTEFRKDGHPSVYRREYKTIEERIAGEDAQDCSHWCLPGVPDIWNELLYASLLKTFGRG